MNSHDQRLLEQARQACFFFDVDDAAARLARANAPYGLAKIRFLQQALGYSPDATFVSTPDATVTRNIQRWNSGVAYGGVFEWSGKFFPVELKPNVCGVAVMGLPRRPDIASARANADRLAGDSLLIDGIEARWDVDHGNHFINVYESPDPEQTSGYPVVVLMHASGRELRGPNPLGPGLYLDDSDPSQGLASMVERLPTPFGPVVFVRDEAADQYVQFVLAADRFARKRREAYLRAIFGDEGEILFNRTHQGVEKLGRMVLGCYSTRNLPSDWVPITLDANTPAYLVRPGAIYSRDAIEQRGYDEIARKMGLVERLIHADVLPHGGGYAFPDFDACRVEVTTSGPEEHRRFRFDGHDDEFEHPRGLAYRYRGVEVIDLLRNLGAGEVVATLPWVGSLRG